MGREDFFLLFENVGHFLLEGKVLFSHVVVFKGRLHYVDIFFYLLLIDFVHLSLDLLFNLLLDELLVLFFRIHSITFHAATAAFLF